MFRRILDFFLNSIQAIVLALSVLVLLYLFVAQPNQVHGTSMLPNFQDQEFLLVEKVTYKFKEPQRGDVVVFKAPPSEPCAEEECEYIKRVLGLPGDTIKVDADKIWINGEALDEKYLPKDFITEPGSFLKAGRTFIVPNGQYVLIGDNRSHSRDCREFGPIAKENIIGKAFFVYWPLRGLRLVPKASY